MSIDVKRSLELRREIYTGLLNQIRSNEMTNQLPEFQCHKKVRAAKIANIEKHGWSHKDGGHEYYLHLEDLNVAALIVRQDWIDKHKPEVGGYVVQYEDGYQSFSPAKAFEDGYTLIE